MTVYKLAEGPTDYAKCHRLMDEQGIKKDSLAYPTVMAMKEGELTGFLSTYISKWQIVAGPLVLKSGERRSWTLIRLIEAYDNVMRLSKVTEYIFSVAKDNTSWLDVIDRTFQLKPYTELGDRLFFVRKL